jgi:hypothetical protein
MINKANAIARVLINVRTKAVHFVPNLFREANTSE